MSRIQNAKRNFLIGVMASVVAIVLSFASRSVFIHQLGVEYLGVNGLFANLLGVLSFAELGIGSAMNYSLYKPVAEGDEARVRGLLRFYRRVYRLIALTVTVIGLAILPFLPLLVRDAVDPGNLGIYYVIFLFNNVISYFAVYKTSIVNAEQRNYLISNINTVATLVTVAAQITVLVVWGSYLGYLITMAATKTAQQIFLNVYLNRKYSHFLKGDAEELAREDLDTIKQNVGALVWHQLGSISVYQTDNIIVSAFINVATVGLVSNYDLVIGSVAGILSLAFGAVTSSFGNLIAVGSVEQQYRVYRVYRFLAFWGYGLAAVGLLVVLEPFVTLWVGERMVLPDVVVVMMVLNFYMVGHRGTLNTIKAAAGLWTPDKHLALVQAVVNLVVSIAMVRLIGLPGVYVGTLTQGALASVVKPIIVFRQVFHRPAREYFIDGAKYAAVVALAAAGLLAAREWFMDSVSLSSLLVLLLVAGLSTNAVFLAIFGRSAEFRFLTNHFLPRLTR